MLFTDICLKAMYWIFLLVCKYVSQTFHLLPLPYKLISDAVCFQLLRIVNRISIYWLLCIQACKRVLYIYCDKRKKNEENKIIGLALIRTGYMDYGSRKGWSFVVRDNYFECQGKLFFIIFDQIQQKIYIETSSNIRYTVQ